MIDGGKYRGVLLSRGKLGFEGFDVCDRSVGMFETAAAAHEAVKAAYSG